MVANPKYSIYKCNSTKDNTGVRKMNEAKIKTYGKSTTNKKNIIKDRD